MISLYSGTPGSGKSLHLADKIIWLCRSKHHVVCNFDVNRDVLGAKYYDKYYHYFDNLLITPALLEHLSARWREGKPVREGAFALILDESQLLFNCREWDASGRESWVRFFTQHRKFGYDVYLVAQFDRMLDRQVRSLIEYEYIHRKVSNYGARGFLLQVLFLAPSLFVSVKMWYPLKERIGSEFFRFRRRLARLYDSYCVFGGASAVPVPPAHVSGGQRGDPETCAEQASHVCPAAAQGEGAEANEAEPA